MCLVAEFFIDECLDLGVEVAESTSALLAVAVVAADDCICKSVQVGLTRAGGGFTRCGGAPHRGLDGAGVGHCKGRASAGDGRRILR